MPAKDFIADGVKLSRLVLSGGISGGGAIGGNKIGLIVYDDAVASNDTGGIKDGSMLDKVGKDVSVFISGSTTPAGRGTVGGAVTLIGGDLHVSGAVSTNGSFSFAGTQLRVPFYESGTGVFTNDKRFSISAASANVADGAGESETKRTVTLGADGQNFAARILELSEPNFSNIGDPSDAKHYALMITRFESAYTGSCGIGFSHALGLSTVGSTITSYSAGAADRSGLAFSTKKTDQAGDTDDIPVERMRITPNGIVVIKGPMEDNLINQPAGTQNLDHVAAGNGNGMLIIGMSDNVGSDPKMVFDQNTIQVKNTDGTIGGANGDLHLQSHGGSLILTKPGAGVADTTNIGIGTSAPDALVHVRSYANPNGLMAHLLYLQGDEGGGTKSKNNYGMRIDCGELNADCTSDGDIEWIRLFSADGVKKSTIQFKTGGDQAEFYFASDQRTKTNITDSNIDSLTKISNLNMKSYRRLSLDGSVGPLVKLGFIAQDVEAAGFDDIVSEKDEEGYDFKVKGLGTSRFIPHLVRAVQQLKQENDSLKARIEALES